MSLDPKELKKLADACRKAGIKHYKSGDIEFTLADEAPVSNYKKRKPKSPLTSLEVAPDAPVKSDGWDTLTEDQKLFYSVQDPLFEAEQE